MPADVVTTEKPSPVEVPALTQDAAVPAPPVTWRHAAIWVCLAAVSLLATLVVLDNFVLVEVRFPGAAVQARLGWVVVTSVGVGFLAGFLAGRMGRRRVSRADPGRPGSG